MKSKFYLIAMCTSLFCTGSVLGNHRCPNLEGGLSGSGDWTVVYNKSPESKAYVFCNAWIYDKGRNEPAKCHYTTKERIDEGKCRAPNCEGSWESGGCVAVSLNKPGGEGGINSDTYHFAGVPYDLIQKGYHCMGPSPDSCIFQTGGVPGKE